MRYSCYKIKNTDISYYLEDSDNRETTVEFEGFRYQGKPIKFAAKNSSVNVFDTNLGISKFFNIQGKPNSNGNFNAIPYGYSPLVRTVADYSTTGKFTVTATLTTGAGFFPDGRLSRRSISLRYEDGSKTGILVMDCPHVFFMTIQGAGGGGGSGGNIRFGNNIQGAGGGSGAVLPLIIKLSDDITNIENELFKIEFGKGGTNSHGNDGTVGGTTSIYDLEDNLIATIDGGNGGIRGQYHNSKYFYPKTWYSSITIVDKRLLSTGIPLKDNGYIRIAPGFETSKVDPDCQTDIFSEEVSTVSLNGIAGKMESYFYAYNKYFGKSTRKNKVKSIPVGYTLKNISDGASGYNGFSIQSLSSYPDETGFGKGLNGADSFVTLRAVYHLPNETLNGSRNIDADAYKAGVGGKDGWTVVGIGNYPTAGTDATFGAGGGGGGRMDGIGDGARGGNGGNAAISIYF